MNTNTPAINFQEIDPYLVTAPGNEIKLHIINAGQDVPRKFSLHAMKALHNVAVRIIGGCKEMDNRDKMQMFEFFLTAFEGYQGVVSSGSTRTAKDGVIDPMVTDVPGLIASANPGCVAMGTAPRVATLAMKDRLRLVLDEWGTSPNPDMSAMMIVQSADNSDLDWDGDVDTYLNMMEDWKEVGSFEQLFAVSWNGGNTSKQEILKVAERGWPNFLIRGSGRETDIIIKQLEDGDSALLDKVGQDHMMLVVDKNEPEVLRNHLVYQGLIVPKIEPVAEVS